MLDPRVVMRNTMSDICNKYSTWYNHIDKDTFIRRIERSCYNCAIDECTTAGIERKFTDPKFRDRYSSICAKINANLDMCSQIGSTYLMDNIMNGNIDSNDIASMTSYQLCPGATQPLRDNIDFRQKQKVDQKVSRLHICDKCGKNETTQYKYQGRSADESENISYQCVHCKHVWRV